jgi:hyperosmotically inducible periplasmic protein
MKRNLLLLPTIAALCLLGAGACSDPAVKEQTRQAGEAIKTAGRETGEAVASAGDAAVAETKAAVEEAGGVIREAGEEAKASAKQAGKDIAEAAERAAKGKIADAALTASVKARLIADTDVKGVSIDVDTVDGRVTLRGTAKTAAQKDEAERIARATEGVISVDNRIVVGSQ